MPTRIFAAFVSSKAANGCITSNPFFFSHQNLSEISVSFESDTNIMPLKMNFDQDCYVQAYSALFEATGVFFRDSGNAISREAFGKGYSIFGFDCSEDLSASEDHLSLPRQGSLRISLKFSKPLAENVNLIIMSEFSSVLEIDKSRNVILDYAS